MKTWGHDYNVYFIQNIYIYFEINVLKHRWDMGGTQKCKIKMISERFKTRLSID